MKAPIYPDYLLLNKTTDSTHAVDFLGMTISNRPKTFHATIANPQQKFPTPKINYPNLHGNFPGASGYGVFTGQLHRLVRICTTAHDFINNTANLYNILLHKGYTHKRMMKTVQTFIRAHNPYKTNASQVIRTLRTTVNQQHP